MYSIYTFVNLRNTHTVHVCVLAHLIPLLLTLFSDCLCGLGAHDQLPQEVSLKRNTFFQECALLLAENGGAVQVKNIQPFYQTRYKKSPRLSDYGSDNMRELLKLSPLFKVLIPCLMYICACRGEMHCIEHMCYLLYILFRVFLSDSGCCVSITACTPTYSDVASVAMEMAQLRMQQ